MNKLIKPTTIYTAVIRKKSKIAAHSIHLQIQSADLDNLSDAAEPTLLIYLADPYQQIDTAYGTITRYYSKPIWLSIPFPRELVPSGLSRLKSEIHCIFV